MNFRCQVTDPSFFKDINFRDGDLKTIGDLKKLISKVFRIDVSQFDIDNPPNEHQLLNMKNYNLKITIKKRCANIKFRLPDGEIFYIQKCDKMPFNAVNGIIQKKGFKQKLKFSVSGRELLHCRFPFFAILPDTIVDVENIEIINYIEFKFDQKTFKFPNLTSVFKAYQEISSFYKNLTDYNLISISNIEKSERLFGGEKLKYEEKYSLTITCKYFFKIKSNNEYKSDQKFDYFAKIKEAKIRLSQILDCKPENVSIYGKDNKKVRDDNLLLKEIRKDEGTVYFNIYLKPKKVKKEEKRKKSEKKYSEKQKNAPNKKNNDLKRRNKSKDDKKLLSKSNSSKKNIKSTLMKSLKKIQNSDSDENENETITKRNEIEVKKVEKKLKKDESDSISDDDEEYKHSRNSKQKQAQKKTKKHKFDSDFKEEEEYKRNKSKNSKQKQVKKKNYCNEEEDDDEYSPIKSKNSRQKQVKKKNYYYEREDEYKYKHSKSKNSKKIENEELEEENHEEEEEAETSVKIKFIFDENNKKHFQSFTKKVKINTTIEELDEEISNKYNIDTKIQIQHKFRNDKMTIDRDMNIEDVLEDIKENDSNILYIKITENPKNKAKATSKPNKSQENSKSSRIEPKFEKYKTKKNESEDEAESEDDYDYKKKYKKSSKSHKKELISDDEQNEEEENDEQNENDDDEDSENNDKQNDDDEEEEQSENDDEDNENDDDEQNENEEEEQSENDDEDNENDDDENSEGDDDDFDVVRPKQKTVNGKCKYYYQTNQDDKVKEIELKVGTSVKQLKKIIGKENEVDDLSNIKIIFAGKDLLNDIILDKQNIGDTILFIYIRTTQDILLMTAKALRFDVEEEDEEEEEEEED